jgi:hypothetical protein
LTKSGSALIRVETDVMTGSKDDTGDTVAIDVALGVAETVVSLDSEDTADLA